MLARKEEISLQLNQIIDSFLLAFFFWLSWWLRFNGHDWWELRPIAEFKEFLWVMAIIVPFMPLALELLGFYRHPLQKTFWDSLLQLFQASIYLGVAIGVGVIFLQFDAASRSVLLIAAFFGGSALLLREKGLQLYLREKLRRGELREPVVMIGRPDDIDSVLQSMTLEQRLELDIVARFEVFEASKERLVRVLHDKAVSRVIFAAEHSQFHEVENALAACESEGVEVWVAADFFQTAIAQPTFQIVGGRPMLVFRSTPEVSWALLFKNLLDRVLAAVLIVITSPLWLIAALGIKLSSKGPVFFCQERGGLYGKGFTMYKFRTMRPDAEALQENLKQHNEMQGPVFKIDQDPRVFPFGRFLRRTSIDEFPQLINVLLGHMSLVGPRPLPSYEVAQIEQSSQRRRLSVKPGITCLWQIGGRNRITDFHEWVALDLEYIDNWSLWLDAKILVRTVPVVLLGLGAS